MTTVAMIKENGRGASVRENTERTQSADMVLASYRRTKNTYDSYESKPPSKKAMIVSAQKPAYVPGTDYDGSKLLIGWMVEDNVAPLSFLFFTCRQCWFPLPQTTSLSNLRP